MKSIRTKLSLLITVLIALSLISISFFGYQSAKKSLNSLNDSYIQTEVKANQDSLSSYFETKSKMVEGIANLEGLQKANPTTGVKAIAAIYPEFQQEFANVSFANASGTRWNYKGEQDTVANRNYFQQAMSTKKTTISDVLVSSTTGKMSMVIASPIMEYGKSPVGIAYTTLPLDEITTNIQQIKYGESGFGYIFTENGVTVAHGKKQDIVGKAFLQDAVQKDPELTLADSPEMTAYWNHRNDGSPFILDNGDGKYINYIVQLSVPTVNPLYFGFSVKEAELNQQIHALARTFLVISCIVLIISIVVSMVFITILITNSIKKLRNVAQQITEGNLDIDINIHSNDEIGEVAKALGGTVVRLKSYQAYINEIALALKDISQGNLTFDLTHDYSGEFSKIKDALTDIRSTLSSTLNQIGEVSELVEGKAAQLSSGASQLAQGTEEQASAIEELSASINEISEKVQTSASHTQETTQTTAESFHLIENSNKEMKNMMSAMEDIRSTSSEIGKIIKTIDDIAFQTNILSLNAAVEAARAGEAGKGFAVVADQVRNLAGMSAEAAKNSASLIETAVKAVNHGADLAETSASMLDQVMESSRKSYQLIEEISRDSSHQAESLAQVTTGVEQISSVVQTSSATAQESAATSAELSEQAEVLRKLVQQFHI